MNKKCVLVTGSLSTIIKYNNLNYIILYADFEIVWQKIHIFVL